MNTQIAINPDRLAKITALANGAHHAPKNGNIAACAMEAVAYVAGERWSDHPKCACPVIGAFMRAWNDGLPDADRTRLLLPLVPRLVGTRGSAELETRRASMAADWFIRVYTPAWLRLAGLTEHADRLASFPEITDFAKVPSLMPVLEAAKKDSAAAWDAARDAARDAAWDAARAAAGDAAWDAARDAAWDAAGAAARDAAGAAARDAAWDAARAAAQEKLSPNVAELQQSALALVERMIAATDPVAEAA